VDPDTAKVELADHAHRATVILCPDRGRQAVPHSVRPSHGFLLAGDALYGDDRAEDRHLHDLVVMLYSGDDGPSVEETSGTRSRAAGLHPGVVGKPINEAGDPGQLVGIVQRTVEHVLVR